MARISSYSAVTTLQDTDQFIVARSSTSENFSMTIASLRQKGFINTEAGTQSYILGLDSAGKVIKFAGSSLGNVYQNTVLTDGSTVNWDTANKTVSTALLDTNRTSLTLNVTNINEGTFHTLFVRKQNSSALTITTSGQIYKVGSTATSNTITLNGVSYTLFKIDFHKVAGSVGTTVNVESVIDDGNKGDITVTNQNTWTINNSAITDAKILSVSWSKITGAPLFELQSNKGIAGGYASLDTGGKVPASQLPSYVDDVLEYSTLSAFPVTGEAGVIYVALDTNKIYRWSGSTYIQISVSGANTVAGTNTQVQFNDAGVFGADSTFTFDKTLNVLGLESIDFAVTPTAGTAERRLLWDNDEGSLNLTLKGGATNIALGAEVAIMSHNAEATTLNKGEVVYLFSAQGQRPSVKRASNLADATSATTFGMVAESIASGANGFIMQMGIIRNVDTNAYNEGDILYLGSTAGSVTTTKPSAPSHYVFVGVVLKKNASSGRIFVKPQNGYELDELHNVAISSVANNDLLVYETISTLWKNKSISTILGYTPEQPLTFSSPLSRSVNTISIPVATSSANGYLSSTDWSTFNSKQAQLNGTGFVKASGTTITYETITLSSDVTGSGTTAITTTISAGAVTLAKMANLSANSIIGNNTGVSATPLALTGTQVTAMLDVFTTSTKGLVPSTAGATTTFLRADGVWATPSGAGISGSGTAGKIPKFTASSAIGDSNISDNGTEIATLIPLFVSGNIYNNSIYATQSGVSTTTTWLGVSTSTTSAIKLNQSTSTGTITAGNNYVAVAILNTTVTEAASGTHNFFANLAIKALGLADAGATTTNAATLYVEGATTGATITNNYSVWIDDGTVRLDAALELRGIPAKTSETNVLYYDPTTFRVAYGTITGGGTGTVTSVSVVTANGISGTVATATTTPAITLTLGAITPTTVNGLTFTAAATGFTIAGGTTSKTLTVSNTLTLAGTDGSTLNIGGGGTLGTAAYTASTAYEPAITTLAISKGGTGTSTAPTAFGIIYAASTTAYASSLSNTTTTKQFLSQTGNGTVSAAPVWGVLASADIPNNAANTSGSAGSVSGTNVITNTNFRQSIARSVIGNNTNATANIADIQSTAADQILISSATAIGWGALTTAAISNSAVTYAKIQNVAANTFLANATASAAAVQEIATTRIPLFATAITGTPSATTYLRGDGSWATITAGSGTVTSVSVVSANGFAGTVATATTTPAITLTTSISGVLKGATNALAAATGADLNTTFGSQTAATVYAAPSGAAGNPSFRALVAVDIPNLDAGKITTGTLAIGRGGTGVTSVTTAPTASSFAGWDANSNLSADNFLPAFTTISTAATTVLDASSSYIQYYTATTGTQIYRLPSNATVGMSFRIINASTALAQTVTVEVAVGVVLAYIPSGCEATFTCLAASTTTTAAWRVSPYLLYYSTAATPQAVATLNTETTIWNAFTFPANTLYVNYKRARITINCLYSTQGTSVTTAPPSLTIRLRAAAPTAGTLLNATQSIPQTAGQTNQQLKIVIDVLMLAAGTTSNIRAYMHVLATEGTASAVSTTSREYLVPNGTTTKAITTTSNVQFHVTAQYSSTQAATTINPEYATVEYLS
jgi:hypothetical protein